MPLVVASGVLLHHRCELAGTTVPTATVVPAPSPPPLPPRPHLRRRRRPPARQQRPEPSLRGRLQRRSTGRTRDLSSAPPSREWDVAVRAEGRLAMDDDNLSRTGDLSYGWPCWCQQRRLNMCDNTP